MFTPFTLFTRIIQAIQQQFLSNEVLLLKNSDALNKRGRKEAELMLSRSEEALTRSVSLNRELTSKLFQIAHVMSYRDSYHSSKERREMTKNIMRNIHHLIKDVYDEDMLKRISNSNPDSKGE